MVTNESGIGEDWAQVTDWVGDKTKAAGQAVGLVEDDLIPGNAETAQELADHLADLGGGFEKAGQGFKRIDDGGWTGQAADGARAYIAQCPPKWFDASDAFTAASKAVAEYQRVLAEQQAKAARAKADLERAEQASDAAREAHNAKVDAFNSSDRTGPRPSEFTDPAAGNMAAARRAIEEAKAAVEAADQRAAQAVRAAAERAPAEPGWLAQKAQDFTDAMETVGRAAGSFATSAGSAVVDLGKMVRLANPFDPHKLTQPAEAAAGFSSMAAGLAGAAMNPYAAAKTIVDIDGWREDPAGTAGSLAPDAIASLAGGAGVASKITRSIGDLADTGTDLSRHVDDITPQRTPDPNESMRTNEEPSQRSPGQDPFVRPNETQTTNPSVDPQGLDARETSSVPEGQHVRPEQEFHPATSVNDNGHGHGGDASGTFDEPSSVGETSPGEQGTPHIPQEKPTDGHQPGLRDQPAPGRHTENPLSPSPDGDRNPGVHGQNDRGDNTGDGDTRDRDDMRDGADHEQGEDTRDSTDQDQDQDQDDTPAGGPDGEKPPQKTEPPWDMTTMLDEYSGEHLPGNERFGTPVRYLDEVEREDFRVTVDDEGLLRDVDGELFDTHDAETALSPDGGRAIFVMDENGGLFASNHQAVGEFHHSSFLAGDPVAAAGELGVRNGKIELISNQSGHYRPGEESVAQFMKQLYNHDNAMRDFDNLDLRLTRGPTEGSETGG